MNGKRGVEEDPPQQQQQQVVPLLVVLVVSLLPIDGMMTSNLLTKYR